MTFTVRAVGAFVDACATSKALHPQSTPTVRSAVSENQESLLNQQCHLQTRSGGTGRLRFRVIEELSILQGLGPQRLWTLVFDNLKILT